MLSKRKHTFLPEISRWFFTPVFPAAVLLSVACIIMSIMVESVNSDMFWAGEKLSVFSYIISGTEGGFIARVSLCLCSLPAAGIYAEDYTENAAYARVQRTGHVRYALGRVFHAAVSAWLCAFLTVLVCVLVMVVFMGMPLARPGDNYGWYVIPDTLLAQNREYEFLFIFAGISGFRAAFYALLAMAFSVFVPNRQAVIAVPLLCWYFNQYLLSGKVAPWLPAWLSPSLLYSEDNILTHVMSISEWQLFWLVMAVTAAVAAVVFLLLLFRIRRNGVFGGGES